MRTLIATTALLAASSAQAQIRITEVAPWSSGNSAVNADWIEITNFGSSAVSISGWKLDDGSNNFGASVALRGITSIGAGQSVIFVESNASGSNDATIINAFNTVWGTSFVFGGRIGTYGGSGVGLGTGGDGVNLFNAGGVNQASVSFGASPTGPVFASFNNAAGLTGAISTLSVVGVNGAYSVAGLGSNTEIGSPGLVAAPIPEPGTWALMLAGMAAVGHLARRRA